MAKSKLLEYLINAPPGRREADENKPKRKVVERKSDKDEQKQAQQL